jgi:exopolysaccharide biosynthesis predicted pyruvyltransferase EpsI
MQADLRHDIAFIHLEEEIQRVTNGKPFIFVVNQGNWGDALIRYGALRFLRSHNFKYTAIGYKEAMTITTRRLKRLTGQEVPPMVFSGGGVFNGIYKGGKQFHKLLRRFGPTLLLPNTLKMPLKDMGLQDGDIIFRRDKFESTEAGPDTPFCHDIAFFIRPLTATVGKGEGNFFRQDAEAPANFTFPEGNRVLSADGDQSTPVAGFFEVLAQFDAINTNRLHVAIAGALLGRKVNLFPNSYLKNHAIFRTSLEPFYPNVRFIDGS